MLYFSNKFFDRIFFALLKFFYAFGYERTLFLRKAFLFVKSCVTKVQNFVQYGTSDMFTQVAIETTTLCNRQCPHCPNSLYDRGQKVNLLPAKLFYKIIDDLGEVNYRGVIMPHLYGEPLLDERLHDLVGYARKKLPNARIIIYTNGDFLTGEVMNSLFDVSGCSFFVTVHDEASDSTMQRLFNVINAENLNKKIRVVCQVINAETPLQNRGGIISVDSTRHAIDYPCCDPLVINYRGDVLLCCNDYFGEVRFGNVKDERVTDIWNLPFFAESRKKVLSGKLDFPICKKCKL